MQRTYYDKCTLGTLTIRQSETALFKCLTLELPYLDNKSNISCIPEGTYPVEFLLVSPSGKYKNTYHICNVPNRLGVLIHAGNTVVDTHGCLLLGLSGYKNSIYESKKACSLLNKATDCKPFLLEIKT